VAWLEGMVISDRHDRPQRAQGEKVAMLLPRTFHRPLVAVAVASAIGLLAAVSGGTRDQTQGLKWYKGNTHAHTLNSDGDSTPDDVVRWYRENGYRFVVLTDHNLLTRVDGLNALHGADEQFLVMAGEEVTDVVENKPLHINGLNPRRVVVPQGGKTVVDVLQRNVDAIRREGGVPHINHPNFEWAITADELARVRNDRLLEIYNGFPSANNDGGGGSPGMEEVWDKVLSSGKRVFGIAVDDAHIFKQPWNVSVSRPGTGWVVVRAAALSASEILGALERGDFYASTGVELEDYKAADGVITVTVKPTPSSKYRIQFIGRNGRLLKEVATSPAAYCLQGDEGYVRVKVLESNGRVAWTQPVFVDPIR
jgi:hypothetical protein